MQPGLLKPDWTIKLEPKPELASILFFMNQYLLNYSRQSQLLSDRYTLAC